MDIFQYLNQTLEQAETSFAKTSENYSIWTQDQVFEESKKGLNLIQAYFDAEAPLINDIKSMSQASDLLAKAATHKDSLKSKTDNLVMIHVDEPGFEQGLEDILAQLGEYHEFGRSELFPTIRKLISESHLRTINNQTENHIFSQIAKLSENSSRI